MNRRHTILVLAAAATLGLAACGGGGGGGGGAGQGKGGAKTKPIVLGTTDKVVSLDPAGSYDLGSWSIIYNVYQFLMKIPAGTTKPAPDAATCKWAGKTTYTCTIKPGQKFSNGDPVTAQDAAFSFQRVVKIHDSNGPWSLLGSMKSVKASGNTVTFTLNKPDATFPYVLTTGAGAIVDHKVFSPTKVQADTKIVGSGPYELKQYTAGQQAVLQANSHYGGDANVANKLFIVRYYKQPSALKLDIEQGNVDIAYRNLSATDLSSLAKESAKGVKVIYGQGTEIRYLTFNLKVMPGSNTAQKLAIRKAVAYTINRQSIAKNVYNGTVKPLYSIIPAGLSGHVDSFAQVYGTSPDAAKAKSALAAAGVKTPVPLTIWWTPSHYGPSSADEYTEIKRQLDASGLFKVTLKSAEWDAYNKQSTTDQYGVFQLGWFPDFPDSDDYTSPFYLCNQEFMNNHYCNKQVDALITKEKTSTDQATRNAAFKQIQLITAKDAPLIPVWQGGQVAAVRNGIGGVKQTLDPSYTFRYWMVSRS